jgi:anaerobic selenocysteine-containing dehydrogenase
LRESDEEIAASALPAGFDMQRLRQAGWVKIDKPRSQLDGAGLRLARGVPLPVQRPDGGMLQLLTPKAHYFLNSSFANQPRQRRSQGRPTLDMNPADAAQRGLTEGQSVRLRNAQGAISATLRITNVVGVGVAALPGKWWTLPEKDSAVANLLSPSASSPGGQPAFNDTFVHVAG